MLVSENTWFRFSSMAFVITWGSMARRMMKGECGSLKRVCTVSSTLSTLRCSTLSSPSTTTISRDCWPEKASSPRTISISRLTSFFTACR